MIRNGQTYSKDFYGVFTHFSTLCKKTLRTKFPIYFEAYLIQKSFM